MGALQFLALAALGAALACAVLRLEDLARYHGRRR